ncbi:RNA exonuclease 4 [Pistacia vera]|uniref:RNA exonuclease 4 n=1 Tax=Pistacia vera TaxID=55513 RepID=UPI001263340A|nr:RNA exonuclease 4 [Pistacia vera]
MDTGSDHPETLARRHKCPACFKQFKRKEHLIEHLKVSYHSVHQPKCGVCQKHCKTYESLHEHLTGPLRKACCSKIFSDLGCSLCFKIFDNPNSLTKHKEGCCLSAPAPSGIAMRCAESQEKISGVVVKNHTGRGHGAVAMDCEMVSGGDNGSLNLCARVCLIDEDENIIFHTHVRPQFPITNYRYDVTGLTEEHLKDAMALNEVRDKILQILYNGESVEKLRLDGGKARLLVGHDLEHDLDCLRMNYPEHMLRDTAKYCPLMKTNLVSHSLKYLTRTYLGYDIQSGVHDPYEDCVAVMRLYKRFSCQLDHVEEIGTQNITGGLESYMSKELMKMSPSELYAMSRSNYRCWCLDSRKIMQP